MVAKGRASDGQKKLSKENVLEILSLAGRMRDQVIADRFGVARGTVRLIQRGKRWAKLSQIAA